MPDSPLNTPGTQPTAEPAAQPSTKEDLVLTAIAIMTEDGWSALRMRDLAKAVGIRAPSIYHHFATKTDLGLAVIDRLTGEVLRDFALITDGTQSLRQRLDALFTAPARRRPRRAFVPAVYFAGRIRPAARSHARRRANDAAGYS